VRAGSTFSPFGRKSVDPVDHHHINETHHRERASRFHGKHFIFGPVKRVPKPIQKWRAYRERRAFAGSSEARWPLRRRFLSAIAETEKLKESRAAIPRKLSCHAWAEGKSTAPGA